MAKKTPNKNQSKPITNKKKVEDQINDLKAELKEEEDKYLRLFAEFENYKKEQPRKGLNYIKQLDKK